MESRNGREGSETAQAWLGERKPTRSSASQEQHKKRGRRGRQRGEQEPKVSVARFCMGERRDEEERARARGRRSRRKEEISADNFLRD